MMAIGPDLAAVMAVLQRDGYRCCRCSAPINGDRGVHWVLHHRRPRAMGGTRRAESNQPQNLLALCTGCHVHVESHRSESLAKGWLVLQREDPATVAVLVEHGSRWVYLTEDGTYADDPVVAA